MAHRIGAILAIAGMLALGIIAPTEAQAEDRCGNTRAERHRIYRAARHRLEANRRQARRILRSCRKRRNVPVHGRRVRSAARTYIATRSGRRAKCRSVTRGVTYSSSVFLGLGTIELATYTLRKTWCWRSGSVVRHPYPEVRADTTRTAWAWDYEGQVAGGEHYEPYRGRFRGSHVSWSQGNFEVPASGMPHQSSPVGPHPRLCGGQRGDGGAQVKLTMVALIVFIMVVVLVFVSQVPTR
jgi:hypothetical protein